MKWPKLPFVDVYITNRWVVGFDLGMLVLGINVYRGGFVIAVPFFYVEYIR